ANPYSVGNTRLRTGIHSMQPSPTGTSLATPDSHQVVQSAAASSNGLKRQAQNTGLYPPRKRSKPSNSTPPIVQDRNRSLQCLESSKLAAATIPAAYHVDDQSEGSRRIQRAHAIDCWYFTIGTNNPKRPSNGEMQSFRVSDQARFKQPFELVRPNTTYLRCPECLKFDSWKVWKNNLGGGVSSDIRKHMYTKHRAAYFAACKRIGYNPERLDEGDENDDICEPVTPEGILRHLTEWFAADDISFNMVSHRGFRRFFSYIGQGRLTTKDIPDRHSVASMAEKLSTEAKERIKREIRDSPGRINCTSDLWSDDSQRSFMCITTHFYNKDRQMVNCLIAFRVVEGTHAGAHLAEIFFETLDEFGIVSKLGLITLDNASNNDTFMAQLEVYMAARGMDFDRHGNRLRCFPHVINLAVQDILAALADSAVEFQRTEESKGSTLTDEVVAYLNALSTSPHDRVRRTAAALRFGQRRQGLQNTINEGNQNGLFRQPKLVDGLWITEEFIMSPLQLILDCPTRWSSTYYMINRFLYLYPAVTRYIASIPSLAEYTITHRDFEVLYDIKTVLSLAHRVQELLSSDKTPTLSYALPLYHALIDQWRHLQSTLPALSHAIGAGIKKIEDYIARVRLSPAYVVAMALNPSIGYRWIDENLPTESGRARDIMKAHMLRCLEDQQRELNRFMPSNPAPLNKAKTATTRLNQGYASVLTAGVDIRPSSSIFSSFAAPASLQSNHTPLPQITSKTIPGDRSTHSSAQLSRLNEATVELEHQKFERIGVPTPKGMEGLGLLDFWMAKSLELPLVFKVALNVLPAQASSVSSERVFSSSKFTCSQYRNRISAPKVEALQILKHALRNRATEPETLDLMAHHVDELLGDTVISTD
ncbi:unnamed protein product, partial [Rhizoctonia solani]